MHLLDSNICVALLKEERNIRKQLRQLDTDEICIPAVVLAELSFGVWKSDFVNSSLGKLQVVLAYHRIIPFDEEAAMQYGRIRANLSMRGTPIGPMDYLIAATALAHDATLITRNTREFSRVPGLRWITL